MGGYRDTNLMMASKLDNNTGAISLKITVFNCPVCAGMLKSPPISYLFQIALFEYWSPDVVSITWNECRPENPDEQILKKYLYLFNTCMTCNLESQFFNKSAGEILLLSPGSTSVLRSVNTLKHSSISVNRCNLLTKETII